MLRNFVEYCKELMCKHDWDIEESIVYDDHNEFRLIDGHYQYVNVINDYPKGKKWTYRCKKCGMLKIKKDY